MSYGSPLLENDIRARALAVAEVLVSSSPTPERYEDARRFFQEKVSAANLPSDEITWFAIERVAAKVGHPAVRFAQEGTTVPAGALVLISDKVPVPESVNHETVRALRAASFVAAPAEWGALLKQARLSAFCVDSGDLEEATASKPRAPRP